MAEAAGEVTYRIGETFDLDRRPGLFDEPDGLVRWFALETQPQREDVARDFLVRHQVEAWFPVEKVWRRVRPSNRERILVERKIVPGYVFGCFKGEPFWDRLLDVWPGRLYFRSVVGVGGVPHAITESEMAAMELLPERLQRQREVEAARHRIRAGDRARVASGILEGRVVEVTELKGQIARIMFGLLGKGEVEVSVSSLEKILAEGSPCSES